MNYCDAHVDLDPTDAQVHVYTGPVVLYQAQGVPSQPARSSKRRPRHAEGFSRGLFPQLGSVISRKSYWLGTRGAAMGQETCMSLITFLITLTLTS